MASQRTAGMLAVIGVALGLAACSSSNSPTAPSGTYTLSGRVQETGGYPVKDARVEIIGGPMSGQVATTDGTGYYVFNSVSGAHQVQASKDGYATATKDIASDTQHVDLVLIYDGPAPSVIGNVYRLTFTASPSCQLPDDARRRTYTATINSRIVTLTGAQFVDSDYCGGLNRFDALVHGGTVSLNPYGAGDCPVVEVLANTRYLSLSGMAEATLTDETSATAFDGSVAVVASPDGSQPIATCTASDHQLVFERIAAPSRR